MLARIPLNLKKVLFALGGIILVGVLLETFLFLRATFYIPEDGFRVQFSGTGVPKHFVTSSGRLVPAPDGLIHVPDAVILETAASPIPGELLALVRTTGDVFVLGIIKADSSFKTLTGDASLKSDLVASQGAAAFTRQTSSISDGKEVPRYEVVFIESENTGEYTTRVIAEGRSPRFLEDGTLLVLSQAGVVRVFPETGEQSSVISRFGADSQGSAISADASLIAIADPSRRALAFYVRDPQIPTSYSFGGMILDVLPLDTAFLDTDSVLVRVAQDQAVIYRIPTVEDPTPRREAFMKILE